MFHKGGIQLVVTPINLLGELNVNDHVSKGFTAIAISAENATKKNFKVSTLTHPIEKYPSHTLRILRKGSTMWYTPMWSFLMKSRFILTICGSHTCLRTVLSV